MMPKLWQDPSIVALFKVPGVIVPTFEDRSQTDSALLREQVGRYLAVGAGIAVISGGERDPGLLRATPVDCVGGPDDMSGVTAAGRKMLHDRLART